MTMSDQTIVDETIKEDEIIDQVELQMDSSLVTTCPQCGGTMSFNPVHDNLKCEYCQYEKEIETEDFKLQEYSFEDALTKGYRTWNEDDIKTFQCKNCGAEIIVSPENQAQFCNYCGSSHIIQMQNEDTIPPHYLIPFKVDGKSAASGFKNWIKKKWFAPRDLKTTLKNDKLMGTYIPHWTYDSETKSFYTAQRGDHYYVTRMRVVNGKSQPYQERHTRWTPVRGNYQHFFDDVLIKASNKVDERLLKKIQPFDFSLLTPYKPEYLSGFYAERYSIGLETGWSDGKVEIDHRLQGFITNKIGGDTVRYLDVKTDYDAITYKHILLPVWLSSFTYKDKVYQFMINGQTGEVQGEYPKSIVKIALVSIAVLSLVGLYVAYVMN